MEGVFQVRGADLCRAEASQYLGVLLVSDVPTDVVFVYSNDGIALVFCGEKGSEPKGEALDLLVHLRSSSPLCS